VRRARQRCPVCGLVWALRCWEAGLGPAGAGVTAPPGKGGYCGEQGDKTRNTDLAAKGKAKRAAGKAAGNPYAQAEGSAGKKNANLKQAGEKLKDTAKK